MPSHLQGLSFYTKLGTPGFIIDNPDLVLSAVEEEHMAALSNEISLIRGVAVVNGIPLIKGACSGKWCESDPWCRGGKWR